MVIASDGVWEFLESKVVIDIVGRYYINNDLDGACDELMKISYQMWTKVITYLQLRKMIR